MSPHAGAPAPATCAALYIIYDADGTRAGELVYMLRKALGLAHCAACDITHGPRVEKPEFTRLKAAGWAVPLRNIHRDEMDAPLAAAVAGRLPVVAARTACGRDVVLLGPAQLDGCAGSVPTLEASVNAALAGAGISVPPLPPLDVDPPARPGLARRRRVGSRDAADAEMAVEGVVAADAGPGEDGRMRADAVAWAAAVAAAAAEAEAAAARRAAADADAAAYRDAVAQQWNIAKGGGGVVAGRAEDDDMTDDAVVPEWTR